MRRTFIRVGLSGLLLAAVVGCSDGSNDIPFSLADSPADDNAVFATANGCYAISPDGGANAIAADATGLVQLVAYGAQDAYSRYLLRPTDLEKFLLYDDGNGYLVSDGESLSRQTFLASDTRRVDGVVVVEDRMQSEGEWHLSVAPSGRFLLQHIKSGGYLTESAELGRQEKAAELTFIEESGCADFPELTLDASGEVTVTEFEDDDSVFGFVDAHSHLFTNLAFGGGGVYHGAPFHPLGVEHALPDCDLTHGEKGRRDFMGGFSNGIEDIGQLAVALFSAELPDDQHATEGYPDFVDWPDLRSETHQVQYYKWIERAYMAGLRLMVQHATTQQTLCQLVVGIGAQPARFNCNDMVSVDRIIEATYELERYIDAMSGGPGQGWFRIVFSPAEAREEIKAGNLAVVLGIETSDLFDCFLVPFGEFSKCTEADVVAKLDEYYERGVRVLFPVHKMDNAFSAGDGDRQVSVVGNFAHTGHYANFIECPEELLEFNGGFDRGDVDLGALNKPREVFDSAPPFDVSGLESEPLGTLFNYINLLEGPPLVGEYCQNHGLTDLGEFLMREMMKRGMIIEVDHFPRKSYKRAYDILEEYDYPAMGTHGRNYGGKLYELGGMSKSNLGRCQSATAQATMDDSFQARIQLMRDNGAFPAEGFAFDLNGFAGAPGPRFGERSNCADPQTNKITYPFKSYAGDVTLEQPVVGNRTLDFNTEGMVHLGLVAELIEDVRRDGVTDEELEPLFKSAEGYIRVWEKSERRAREMGQ